MRGPDVERTLARERHDSPRVRQLVVGKHPQRGVDDSGPVDAVVAVHVDPQVVDSGIPRPPLGHDQGGDASDDRVHQRSGHLKGGGIGRMQILQHAREHAVHAMRRLMVGAGDTGRDRPPAPLALMGHGRDGVDAGVVGRDLP